MTIETSSDIFVQDIEGLGRLSWVRRPLPEALAFLGDIQAELIDSRDFAYSRIKAPDFLSLGSQSKESVLYGSSSSILTKEPLILTEASLSPEVLERCHLEGREYFVADRLYERVLESAKAEATKPPQQRTSLLLKKSGNIPTKRFGEEELTLFLFDDAAKEYGRILNDAGLHEISFPLELGSDYVSQRSRFLRQVYHGPIVKDSPYLSGVMAIIDAGFPITGLRK